MRFKRDDIRGWIGSIILHILAGIIMLLVSVDTTPALPEYVEVAWGPLTTPSVTSAASSMRESFAVSRQSTEKGSRTVNLPERNAVRDEQDVIPVYRAEKLAVDDAPPSSNIQKEATDARDKGLNLNRSGKDRGNGPATTDLLADAKGTAPVSHGVDGGAGVSYSMSWGDGGTRKKISGRLPEYPEGANVEAQIKLQAVVLPDGSIRTLKPLQKAHMKLEDAALSEVRLWKFEPLHASLPQREQVCTIVFNFRLQ